MYLCVFGGVCPVSLGQGAMGGIHHRQRQFGTNCLYSNLNYCGGFESDKIRHGYRIGRRRGGIGGLPDQAINESLHGLLGQAADALQQQQYQRTIELCERILQKPARSMPMTAAAHHLKCQALCRGPRCHGRAALKHGRLAVLLARRSGNRPLLMECLLDAAVAAIYGRRYRRGALMLQELIQMEPPPALLGAARKHLGWILYLQTNYGLAVREYSRACAALPTDPHVRLNYAMALIKRGRPWRAMQLTRQALELVDPGDRRGLARVLLTQACCLLAVADFQAAAGLLQRGYALAIGEADQEMMAGYHLAITDAALKGRAPADVRRAVAQMRECSAASGRLDLCDLADEYLAQAEDQELWPAPTAL